MTRHHAANGPFLLLSVAEALNWTTGETVAIKKISVSDIPKAELGDIMVR